MNWPPVCILLLTYDRLEYAKRTLQSALENLHYSGKISVHIADDGSPDGYVDKLNALAGSIMSSRDGQFQYPVSRTNSRRGGYGANYNLGTQVAHEYAEIILPLEDDWELSRPLNLDILVEALQAGEFGCIRLGYIGYTQQLKGEFVYVSGNHYLRFDPDSPEPHVWAGHPRLETREWQRRVGPWNEGLDPGSTEFEVTQRREAREGVVWPLDLVHPSGELFSHIGTRQARADQREAALA